MEHVEGSTEFRFNLEHGYIRYSHQRDQWQAVHVSGMNGGPLLPRIGASNFSTIREFKAWGQDLINKHRETYKHVFEERDT